jgi:ATP/maltotriose-dependent transcriptional regulator MalT
MHQPLTAPERLDLVNLLVSHLSKALFASLNWQVYPTPLGEPFTALTEREWVVLCGLRSDDGEKQLADRLRLSPHTLHSHIKSIYRKLGVQGRLPLLQRLDAAMRDYRVKVFSGLASGTGAQLDRLAG